jgi:hypothetical protein
MVATHLGESCCDLVEVIGHGHDGDVDFLPRLANGDADRWTRIMSIVHAL